MFVVIDTNILVSAMWSRQGGPAEVLALVLNGFVTPCHDYRIIILFPIDNAINIRYPRFRTGVSSERHGFPYFYLYFT
jgi:hypothetical protein